MSNEVDDAIEALFEQAKVTGAATASVSDGHIFVFSHAELARLVERSEERGYAVVFVARGMHS